MRGPRHAGSLPGTPTVHSFKSASKGTTAGVADGAASLRGIARNVITRSRSAKVWRPCAPPSRIGRWNPSRSRPTVSSCAASAHRTPTSCIPRPRTPRSSAGRRSPRPTSWSTRGVSPNNWSRRAGRTVRCSPSASFSPKGSWWACSRSRCAPWASARSASGPRRNTAATATSPRPPSPSPAGPSPACRSTAWSGARRSATRAPARSPNTPVSPSRGHAPLRDQQQGRTTGLLGRLPAPVGPGPAVDGAVPADPAVAGRIRSSARTVSATVYRAET